MIKRMLFIIVPLLLMLAADVAAGDQKVVMEIEGMTCAL